MFKSANSSQKTLKKHVYFLALIVGVSMVGSVSNKKIHIKNNILSMEKRNHNNQTKYFRDPSVEKLIKFFPKMKIGLYSRLHENFFWVLEHLETSDLSSKFCYKKDKICLNSIGHLERPQWTIERKHVFFGIFFNWWLTLNPRL